MRTEVVTKHANPPPAAAPPRTLMEYFRRPGALSQRQLARRLGCHQSHISMIAHGQRVASGEIGVKLEEITQVPLKALVVKRRAHRKKKTPQS